MKKSKAKPAIILILIAAIVIVGLVGVLYYFFNKEDIVAVDFDVYHKGEVVNDKNYQFRPGVILQFDVKSETADIAKNLKVRVAPSDLTKTIVVTYGDSSIKLSEIKHLTDIFEITIDGTTVSVTSQWDIKGYFAEFFGVAEENVAISPNYVDDRDCYYILEFIVGKSKVTCGLLSFHEVNDLEISNDSIIVGEL